MDDFTEVFSTTGGDVDGGDNEDYLYNIPAEDTHDDQDIYQGNQNRSTNNDDGAEGGDGPYETGTEQHPSTPQNKPGDTASQSSAQRTNTNDTDKKDGDEDEDEDVQIFLDPTAGSGARPAPGGLKTPVGRTGQGVAIQPGRQYSLQKAPGSIPGSGPGGQMPAGPGAGLVQAGPGGPYLPAAGRPTYPLPGGANYIMDADSDAFDDKPWRKQGQDPSDYFNYGFNEETWRQYCNKQAQLRMEQSMQGKIRVYESQKPEQKYELPPELMAMSGSDRRPASSDPKQGTYSNKIPTVVGSGRAQPGPRHSTQRLPHHDDVIDVTSEARDESMQREEGAQNTPPVHPEEGDFRQGHINPFFPKDMPMPMGIPPHMGGRPFPYPGGVPPRPMMRPGGGGYGRRPGDDEYYRRGGGGGFRQEREGWNPEEQGGPSFPGWEGGDRFNRPKEEFERRSPNNRTPPDSPPRKRDGSRSPSRSSKPRDKDDSRRKREDSRSKERDRDRERSPSRSSRSKRDHDSPSREDSKSHKRNHKDSSKIKEEEDDDRSKRRR